MKNANLINKGKRRRHREKFWKIEGVAAKRAFVP